jgi:hypothetical protein
MLQIQYQLLEIQAMSDIVHHNFTFNRSLCLEGIDSVILSLRAVLEESVT